VHGICWYFYTEVGVSTTTTFSIPLIRKTVDRIYYRRSEGVSVVIPKQILLPTNCRYCIILSAPAFFNQSSLFFHFRNQVSCLLCVPSVRLCCFSNSLLNASRHLIRRPVSPKSSALDVPTYQRMIRKKTDPEI
jgi:hypothetical protein